MTENEAKVIRLAQDDINDVRACGCVITVNIIKQIVSKVLLDRPNWSTDIDIDSIEGELCRRFSTVIGEHSVLNNNENHQKWLNLERKNNWRYWQRYRDYLQTKLDSNSIEELDRSTDTILGELEDPLSTREWDRRGLVVGEVQSGKTTNYTALICKAADAGFKIILVLSGLYNNLRTQTQVRLEEGFLGFSTSEGDEIIGVGLIDDSGDIRPQAGTHRGDNGDFRKKPEDFNISPEQKPWLFVVKKNVSVLKRLFTWITKYVADQRHPLTRQKIVTRLPILIIDDEADNASVDTGGQFIDEDGNPDKNYSPTAINGEIRRILNSFSKSAYVGYTATPFANIFIHEKGETPKEGPDLFPSAFILSLESPSNYVGPNLIFGSLDKIAEKLPLVEHIDNYEVDEWLPRKHNKRYSPKYHGEDSIPPSLKDAILYYLIGLAVRKCRGQGTMHTSMLIHVTRYNDVQEKIKKQVADYLKYVKQRLLRNIEVEDILNRFQHLWEGNFLPANKKIVNLPSEFGSHPLPSFEEMASALTTEISNVKVEIVNGKAKDVLSYDDNKATGLKVIAIGGDKLSRGLTLEGLTVSYFLRASIMYDTLLQMGRWFGYRPGYLDICRLYIPIELEEWYRDITAANNELREAFKECVLQGKTPREYGLKVRSHSTLLVTSKVKMRNGKKLKLSFSGDLVQTVALYNDKQKISYNYESMINFLDGLNEPSGLHSPSVTDISAFSKRDGYKWDNVPYERVVNFLNVYISHPKAYRVNTKLLAEFITKMADKGALTSWTVALVGSGEKGAHRHELSTNNLIIGLPGRGKNGDYPDRYSIGTLISPQDEAIDLDNNAWQAALDRRGLGNVPRGADIRYIRGFGSPAHGVPAHPERGLLLLYLLDPKYDNVLPDIDIPVVALALSFPSDEDRGVSVDYVVNNVYWENEYGN